MSHARITIACACTMFLVGSFLAFGSTKDVDTIESKIEAIEETISNIQVVCTCECEETTESDSEEEVVEKTEKNKKKNKTKKDLEQTITEETNYTSKEVVEENIEIKDEIIEQIEPMSIAPETEPEYITKYVPSNNSFKSYMSYKAITSKSSPQYKLQQQAYTGEYGIRMVDGRYCIALGSFYSNKIGTKIDLVMANGSVLKCILSDQKANIHTDAQNIRAQDGSVVEFVIDKNSLHPMAKRMGNISYAADKFSGEIKEIRVYQ